MKFQQLAVAALTVSLMVPVSANAARGGGGGGSGSSSSSVDFNEETHMMFMREEEKLARDVYTMLGATWPDQAVFSGISGSEQGHTDSVKNLIEGYGLTDPNTNDNVGAYTGEDYAGYFTEKYKLLVDKGSINELEALYVGAFIEELDMLDIVQCPQAIIDIQRSIRSTSDCGLNYTDEDQIQTVFGNLLDGSKSHLRAYVGRIENVIGDGNYVAQVLTQEEVNAILGR